MLDVWDVSLPSLALDQLSLPDVAVQLLVWGFLERVAGSQGDTWL